MKEPDNSDPEEGMGDRKQCTLLLGSTYQCKREDGTYHDAEVEKFRMNTRAGREEYFVHYIGLPRRQSEWVDKTRLVSSKSEKEENTEDGADQKTSDVPEASQDPRSEEEGPEAKKVKLDTSVMVCGDEEDPCMACGELREDHVMVECGHCFCQSCIHKAQENLDSLSCPECKKMVTEKNSNTDPALADMQKTVGDTAALSLAKPEKVARALPFINCDEHEEILKFYCDDDGLLGCIICRDSLKHNGHKFLPIMDAVELYETELSSVMSPLEEAWKKNAELTIQQREKIEQLQNTMTEYRQHILSEFGNLYGFLRERKEQLLEQLQEQNKSLLEEMEPNAAKLEKCRDSVTEALAVYKMKMYETQPVSFLHGIQELLEKCQESQKALADNRVIENELCRATFSGPLQYITWKQMKSIVPDAEPVQQPEPPESEFRLEELSELNMPDVNPAEQPAPPLEKKTKISPVKLPELNYPETTNIWIVGNGYINAIHDREKGTPGLKLGFENPACEFRWLCMNEHCDQLVSEIYRFQGKPDILFFHFGSTCLEEPVDFFILYDVASEALNRAAKLYPNAEFILSALYPETEGSAEGSAKGRSRFLKMLKLFAERYSYVLHAHDELQKMMIARCSQSQNETLSNNISDEEANLFIKSIQDSLLNALIKKLPPAVRNPAVSTSSASTNTTPIPNPALPVVEKTQCSLVKPPVLKPSDTTPVPIPALPVVEKTQCSPVKPPALKPPEAKKIWILGTGHMTAVNLRAQKCPLGLNLGFDRQTCTIHWFCSNNIWLFFRRLKTASSELNSGPDIVLYHFGGNTSEQDFKRLLKEVKKGVSEAVEFLPKAQFIISTLYLPKNPDDAEVCDQFGPKWFTSSLAKFAEHSHFGFLAHDELQKMLLARRSDSNTQMNESKLTATEADLFISGVQDSLQKALIKNFETADKSCEIPVLGAQAQPSAENVLTNKKPVEQPTQNMSMKNTKTKCRLIKLPAFIQHTLSNQGTKEIWIVGNGFINALHRRIEKSVLGLNLGFESPTCKFSWFCMNERCDDFISTMNKDKGTPDVIFFHFGSTNLEQIDFNVLFDVVTKGLDTAAKLFPNAEFILSLLYPKTLETIKGYANSRNGFFNMLRTFAECYGCALLAHDELQNMIKARCSQSQIQMHSNYISDSEADLFIERIQDSLLKALIKKFKPVGYSFEDSDQPSARNVTPSCSFEDSARPSTQNVTSSCSFEDSARPSAQNVTSSCSFEDSAQTSAQNVTPSCSFEDSAQTSAQNVTSSCSFEDSALPSAQNATSSCSFEDSAQTSAQNVKLVTDGFRKSPRTAGDVAEPKQIWIIGDKYILNAGVHAEKKNAQNLQLDVQEWKVHWFGRTSRWFTLVPEMQSLRLKLGLPSVVYVHIGYFDMIMIEHLELVKHFNVAIEHLLKEFPTTKFVISTTLRWGEWLIQGQAKLRKMFNTHITTHAAKYKYLVARNCNLDSVLVKRCNADQTYSTLTFQENDLFIKNIEVAVEKAIGAILQPSILRQKRLEKIRKKFLWTAGSPTVPLPEPRQIWIIGDEYILNAGVHAEKKNGQNLQLDVQEWKVHWFGRTSRWSELVPEMQSLRPKLGLPSVVYVHIGHFDTKMIEHLELVKHFNVAIEHLLKEFPTTKFIISTTLRWTEWLIQGLAKLRKMFNKHIIKHAEKYKYLVTLHRNLDSVLVKRRLADKTFSTLTFQENDLFVKNIEVAVEKAIGAILQPSILRQKRLEKIRKKFLWTVGSPTVPLPDTSHAESTIEDKKAAEPEKTSDTSHAESTIEDKKAAEPEKTSDSHFTRASHATSTIEDKKAAEPEKTSDCPPPVTIQEMSENSGDTTLSKDLDCPAPVTSMEMSKKSEDPALPKDDCPVPVTSMERSEKSEDPALPKDDCPVPVTSMERSKKSEDPALPKDDCPAPVKSMEMSEKSEDPALPKDAVKQIWIVGNSYICRAVRQANSRLYGENFGFEVGKWTVHWMGQVAMRWEALLPKLNNALSKLGAPHVVFIHLGDNDLGCLSYDQFTDTLEIYLSQLTIQFPKTEFVYSAVLPRAEWLRNGLEQTRQDVNAALASYVEELGFVVVKHKDIEEKAMPRFKTGDGSAISDSEFDLFVKSIRDSVEDARLRVEKTFCKNLVH